MFEEKFDSTISERMQMELDFIVTKYKKTSVVLFTNYGNKATTIPFNNELKVFNSKFFLPCKNIVKPAASE